MWQYQLDQTLRPPQPSTKVIDSGAVRMTGQHKIQMNAAHAWDGVDQMWFDLDVTVTRNIRLGPDAEHDDDYALFVCEAGSYAATADSWRWWAEAGCAKFLLWDSDSETSYFLRKEICTAGSCTHQPPPAAGGYVTCGDSSSYETLKLRVEARPLTSHYSARSIRFNMTWRAFSDTGVEFCAPQSKLVDLAGPLVAGVGVDEEHGRYTIVDDFRLRRTPHPPLSPPPPSPPSPPPPSPSPPPSPPRPPPCPPPPKPPPSPPPKGRMLLDDRFRSAANTAAWWPQIEAGKAAGGPADGFDVAQGVLALTGSNTYAKYNASTVGPVRDPSTPYHIEVSYRTSVTGDDMEVDNDAIIALCPAGTPFNGDIWSATPGFGLGDDACVRVGLAATRARSRR